MYMRTNEATQKIYKERKPQRNEGKKLYRNKKMPLPNLPPLDLPIRNQLTDIHNTDKLRNMKKRAIEPFDMVDFLKVISKTKKKAPGKDGLFINQIKVIDARYSY